MATTRPAMTGDSVRVALLGCPGSAARASLCVISSWSQLLPDSRPGDLASPAIALPRRREAIRRTVYLAMLGFIGGTDGVHALCRWAFVSNDFRELSRVLRPVRDRRVRDADHGSLLGPVPEVRVRGGVHSGGGPGGHRKAQRSAIRGAQNSWATWRKGRGIAAVARVARPVGRAARSGGSRRVSPSRFRRRRLHRRVAGDAGGLRFMPGAREG